MVCQRAFPDSNCCAFKSNSVKGREVRLERRRRYNRGVKSRRTGRRVGLSRASKTVALRRIAGGVRMAKKMRKAARKKARKSLEQDLRKNRSARAQNIPSKALGRRVLLSTIAEPHKASAAKRRLVAKARAAGKKLPSVQEAKKQLRRLRRSIID